MVKRKSTPTKIEPFGETLDPSVAMLQAANALDVAAQFAELQSDSGRLIEIAQIWVVVSQRLGGGGNIDSDDLEITDGESETSTDKTQFKMGFTAVKEKEL